MDSAFVGSTELFPQLIGHNQAQVVAVTDGHRGELCRGNQLLIIITLIITII